MSDLSTAIKVLSLVGNIAASIYKESKAENEMAKYFASNYALIPEQATYDTKVWFLIPAQEYMYVHGPRWNELMKQRVRTIMTADALSDDVYLACAELYMLGHLLRARCLDTSERTKPMPQRT